MTACIRQSCLSTGGLALTLKNENGQLQDALFVKWTISSAHDGRRVSGIGMNAVRSGVGKYYAPWFADDPTGSFVIEWEYQRDHQCAVEKFVDRFFVMDLDDPVSCSGHIKGLPHPGGRVFEPGYCVSGKDMTLCFTDSGGSPACGHMVAWRIEEQNGREVTPWRVAKTLGVGVYVAEFTVTVNGGQYLLRWQWSESPESPLQQAVDYFQVVNPVCPRFGVEVVGFKVS